MKKVNKGKYGYISYQKRRRVVITVILFLLPIGLFIIGITTTHSRLNLFTIIAILGCLPACQSAVGMIMMLLQKKMPQEHYEAVREAAGDLITAYELVITAYEHTTPLEAAVVCGSEVVCFTADDKTEPSYIQGHISQILKDNGIKGENVKVMKDFKQFLVRVSSLRDHQDHYRESLEFTPDERYPDLSRDEIIYHLLLAIAL